MTFARGLPKILDAHLKKVTQQFRTGLGRQVTCFIPQGYTDFPSPQGKGFDAVSGGPIDVTVSSPSRTQQYLRVPITARVRWEAAQVETPGPTGVIKEGACTIYVGIAESSWVQKTQGSSQGYLSIDGQTMKVVAGPQQEGMGQILEHSYVLDQYLIPVT